ncbi:hypothetical protein OIU34_23195 [Pararhizobium sp. BT-229]|uniref:hypothetical protein n=1 Tax=Pararhizobium sp. BT-229 TaxID=2986923 RepID=UPI0021F7A987|nr:hypothetical protein [Pararhizobium sp. BT-229]MCV9964802.1 hypothetical protein [Pararhizobium sp. BT-229]
MKAKLRVHFNQGRSMIERWEEKVEVEFREPSEEDAPLAFESTDATTRWFEGRHYRAYTLFASRDPEFRNVTDAKAIVDFLENRPEPHAQGYTTNGYPDPKNPQDGYLANGYFEQREESKDRKFSEKRYPELIEEPNRVKQVGGAKAFANDCIIVDDKFWVACAEPKLVIGERRIYVDTKHRLLGGGANNMNQTNAGIGLIAASFRADEVEELAAAAGHVGHAAPEILLHAPDSIKWKRREENVVMAAKLLLRAWSKKDIVEVHPDIGQALVNVNRVLWNTPDDQLDIDALGDQLAAAVNVHIAQQIGMSSYRKVCDDWFERPIEIANTLGSAGCRP